MFSKPRRSKLSRALEEAADPELRAVRAEIARRQERAAELELELFDLRASLAEFERELEIRVRPLERELLHVRAELDQVRRAAARRAQWGERAAQEGVPDVVEQFRKAWTPRTPPATAAPKPTPSEPQQNELRALYRELAKRFHPDLTSDPRQKPWREEMMAKVNLAYEASDLAALQALRQQVEPPPEESPAGREQRLVELHGELRRLDRVITDLQSEIDRVERSEVAQLKLDAVKARLNGYDLLAAMARDFGTQIAQARAELASLA